MKFLDKIVLNRLLSIITNFILGLLKIFTPDSVNNIDKKKKRRWRRTDD